MITITDKQYSLFENFINTHDSFIVAGHKEPDGDCIASSLVLKSIIKKLGKPCTVLSSGPFKRSESKQYEALFMSTFTPLSNNPKKIGLFIVDCSEHQRLGEEVEKQVKMYDSFIIDHHKTAQSTDNSIIVPTSPSTTCLIQQLYEHSFDEIDKDDACLLFFGLSTDTGFFRFLGKDSEDVFLYASRLVKAGANPRTISEDIESGKPFLTRKLLSICLDRAKQYFDGKLIITYETMEDTYKYGKEGRDNDSLYQLLLSTDKVQAVVFLRQETENQCTAGFRSKGNIDVSMIASKFGGGGHKNASGLSTQEKIATFIPRILDEFKDFI